MKYIIAFFDLILCDHAVSFPLLNTSSVHYEKDRLLWGQLSYCPLSLEVEVVH